jgi:hypothetical protein
MALAADPNTDVPAACAQLRNLMLMTANGVKANMAAMRTLVTGRKAAIVAALGTTDAADMATLYGKLKDFADTATGGNEPGIPAS